MKYLIIFILGFCTHKALNTVYDYSFWTNNSICEKHGYKNLDEEFACTYKKMGVVQYPAYPLANYGFSYGENKWGWKF